MEATISDVFTSKVNNVGTGDLVEEALPVCTVQLHDLVVLEVDHGCRD